MFDRLSVAVASTLALAAVLGVAAPAQAQQATPPASAPEAAPEATAAEASTAEASSAEASTAEASTAGEPDDVVLPKRYPPTSVRWKLVGGGVAVTGLAYGAAFLCASNWPEAPGSDALKVPVVGPWIALGQSGCSKDDPDCGATAVFRAILTVLDGVIQAGGLGIAGEGLFMTTEAPQRPVPSSASARREVVVRPMPIVTEHTTGMGVVGTF